jgi:hypothetical protein
MRKYLLLLAAAAFIAAPRAANAGYTAVTGTDAVLTPDTNGNLIADVGETFATAGPGTFVAWLPDGPTDPQINNNDLNLYGYSLNGAVTAVAGNKVTYGGTYKIQYFDPSQLVFDVSTGTFVIDATFDPNGGAALDGWLFQTAGPAHPAFQDLGYCGPVSYKGTYAPVTFGRNGTIQGVLTTSCIPEPGSMALLATGLLPLLGLRRRK